MSKQFSQLFTWLVQKSRQILPSSDQATKFILAIPLFQAKSCLQDERCRTAGVIAADRWPDGFPCASLLAVGPDSPAPSGFRL